MDERRDDWRDPVAVLLAGRGQALKRYAFLLCGDDHEADDLVQAALVSVLVRTRRTEPASLEAYVRRAVLNEYLDRARARRTWLRYAPRLVAVPDSRDWTVDAARDGDLRAGLSALSPRQRACVVLRFYEDLTVPEVARALGCGEGTVKRHLSEAMTRLRQRLAEDA